MKPEIINLFVADALLFMHVLVVAFNIFGLMLIFLGKLFSWSWIRNPWFRTVHLVSIVVVVVLSWLGLTCPLTTWEMAFRAKARDTVYGGSFISHWLDSLLYYQAPEWVFIVCYTLFGSLVVVSWFWIRPRKFTKFKNSDTT